MYFHPLAKTAVDREEIFESKVDHVYQKLGHPCHIVYGTYKHMIILHIHFFLKVPEENDTLGFFKLIKKIFVIAFSEYLNET